MNILLKLRKIYRFVIHCKIKWILFVLLITVFLPNHIKLLLAMSSYKNIAYSITAFFIQADLIQWLITSMFTLIIVYILQKTEIAHHLIIFFVIGGIITNVICMIYFLAMNQNFEIIGSSGGVMCLFGMLISILIFNHKMPYKPEPAVYIIIGLLIVCLYLNPSMLDIPIQERSFVIHSIGLVIGTLPVLFNYFSH